MQLTSRTFRMAVLIAVLAAIVFALPGFDGRLLRDDGIYLYGGQQFSQGVLPYISVFDHKGPGAAMICGAGIRTGELFGFGDIESCRATFYGFAVLAAVMLFLLVYRLLNNRLIAFAGAAAFTGFWGLTMHVASGPKAKVSMLLLEISALYLATRKQWFWSAFFGASASLVWQPMGLICIAVFLACLIQDCSWRERIRDASIATAGGTLPVALVAGLYASHGGLPTFIDGWVLFNFIHLDRGDATIAGNAWHLGGVVLKGKFASSSPVFVAAGLGFSYLYLQLVRHGKSALPGTLDLTAWLPVLLLAPAFVTLALLDFQGTGDVLPLLPFVVIGFALLLIRLDETVTRRSSEKTSRQTIMAIIALVTISGMVVAASNEHAPLSEQKDIVEEIESLIPENGKVITIGAPEYMVLSHRTSPSPFLFIINGIDSYITSQNPDGFQGWLSSLERDGVTHVVYGPTRGRQKERLENWLSHGFSAHPVGPWVIYQKDNSDSTPKK